MKISEMKHTASTRLLADSALWEREVNAIKPIDVQIFLRLHWGKYEYTLALSEIEGLLKTIWDEVLYGRIMDLPEIAFFEVPKIRMTSCEFGAYLSHVEQPYRRAIVFLLETGLSVDNTIGLKHKDLKLIEGLVTETALAAAQSQPPHKSLHNVFWHTLSNKSPSPLLDLPDAVHDVSQGMGLPALRQLYKHMVYIDQDSDLSSFSEITDIPLGLFKTIH